MASGDGLPITKMSGLRPGGNITATATVFIAAAGITAITVVTEI
jgi:hypothetical protein